MSIFGDVVKTWATAGTNQFNRGGLFGPSDVNTAGGMPGYPNYISPLDSANNINPKYLLNGQEAVKSRYDDQSLNALQNMGLAAPGTSAWEQMMLGQQGQNEATARDNAMRGADTAKLSAYSDLATHGGLSTGAKERLARTSSQGANEAKQGVARQGVLDRYGIGSNAEDRRTGALGQSAGLQLQKGQQLANIDMSNRDYATNLEKYNKELPLNQMALKNAANLSAYDSAMKGWAASKQADATTNSGKK